MNIALSLRRAALLTALVITACQSQAPAPAPSAEETGRELDEPAPVADTPGPMEELAGLDDRRPVPLQPMMAWHQKQNMMEHLVAIQRITDGVAREDWEAVASASALIETSPQMQQMCRHMGAGAEGFTDMALEFHRRADAIGEAARAEDGAAVLRATSHTLEACTTCHAAFRQEVVDAATWQVRTGEAHDPMMMHDPEMMHGVH
jgi:hypothetical protein